MSYERGMVYVDHGNGGYWTGDWAEWFAAVLAAVCHAIAFEQRERCGCGCVDRFCSYCVGEQCWRYAGTP